MIYARQSKDSGHDERAIERQVDACRQLCAMRGWEVVGEPIVDNDVSASSGKPRPGYERVVAMMQAGAIDVVAVYALDRFVRKLADLVAVVDLVKHTGAKLATVTGDLDLSTDTGRRVAGILASVAQGEVERKGSRQRAANRNRTDGGGTYWTRRPFGYTRGQGLDSPVVVVDVEAAALREVVAMVIAGSTLTAAVRRLAELGVPTTTGRPFSVTTLRRILLNPRHAGRGVYQGAENGVTGSWPAIISPGESEQLAGALRDPARRVRQGTVRKYLLSGALACGVCGAAMYGSPQGAAGGARWAAYRCRTGHLSRRVDQVDQVVEGALRARLARPDAVDLFDISGADVAERWADLSLARRRGIADLLVRVTILPQGKGHLFDPATVVIGWLG